MIIVFSEKTSKILPKIFCKKFRHCAIVFEHDVNKYLLLNPAFKRLDIFKLNKRDLNILKQHGWVCIEIKTANLKNHICSVKNSLSCVGFVKNVIGIKNPFIWTPDQLYRKITKK